MRIAVVGDFHMKGHELHMTEQAMEDVASVAPDLVVPLGDFGTYENIGGVEGLHDAYKYLSKIGAPMRPILGNHDLQRETGGGPQEDGTMEREMNRLFALDRSYGVLEYDHVRLFFIGTESQPADSCYQIQECYVTDERFAWLESELKRRPGVPVILFTHAPPLGCDLRTVPEVHVRATNAYLDQNHQATRWIELARNYEDIILWFSAHYHLSHIYPDSIVTKYGTSFVSTGVHGSCTRDDNRQSRIIDIEDGKIKIYTLDHVKRELYTEPDWDNGKVLVREGAEAERASETGLLGEGAADGMAGSSGYTLVTSYAYGNGAAIPNGIVPLDRDRCLIATEDGFLWEVLHPYRAVIGTLHFSEPLTAVAVTDSKVWRAWDNKLSVSDPNRLTRFVRERQSKEEEASAVFFTFHSQITGLAGDRSTNTLWVRCGSKLYHVAADGVVSEMNEFDESFWEAKIARAEVEQPKLRGRGENTKVTSITAEGDRIYLSVVREGAFERPRLEVWEKSP